VVYGRFGPILAIVEFVPPLEVFSYPRERIEFRIRCLSMTTEVAKKRPTVPGKSWLAFIQERHGTEQVEDHRQFWLAGFISTIKLLPQGSLQLIEFVDMNLLAVEHAIDQALDGRPRPEFHYTSSVMGLVSHSFSRGGQVGAFRFIH
jgi:hypothetical protein